MTARTSLSGESGAGVASRLRARATAVQPDDGAFAATLPRQLPISAPRVMLFDALRELCDEPLHRHLSPPRDMWRHDQIRARAG